MPSSDHFGAIYRLLKMQDFPVIFDRKGSLVRLKGATLAKHDQSLESSGKPDSAQNLLKQDKNCLFWTKCLEVLKECLTLYFSYTRPPPCPANLNWCSPETTSEFLHFSQRTNLEVIFYVLLSI
jgi:hypothetical protein